ncbi:MAG: putative non-heme bromoperoxidase BpoC [Betaproteobacteria bacterium ADurb.Bin341]|nr:MAG: putative non-heme bromoperoxidase BpoC [Betaproteobacteria bacterium ADurb.Bin341]
MTPRKIHSIRRYPDKSNGKPPLLFIHGGYVHAGCWDIHFLPYFAAQGYDCHAIDLSGHGLSEGHDCLDCFGLADYIEDAANAVGSLKQKPIIIGHSMGASIVEGLLPDVPVEAAILLSPVPTIGTLGALMRLSSRYPRFLVEISRISRLQISEDNLLLMRNVYFSPQMLPQDLLAFAHLIQEESQRAVLDLLMLACRFQPVRPKLPVLVMGGELDLLFPPSLLPFMARRWQAEMQVIPATGHVVMLDVQWEDAANRMLAWLEKQGY